MDWTLEYKTDLTCYIVPNQAFDMDTGEEMTFSCTITAQEQGTYGVAVLINWSPDGNIRYSWLPVTEDNVAFETSIINLVRLFSTGDAGGRDRKDDFVK